MGAVDISIAHRGLCSSCVNISAFSDSPLSWLSYAQCLVWINTSCLLLEELSFFQICSHNQLLLSAFQMNFKYYFLLLISQG